MQLEVVNIKGEKTGKKVELPKEVFGIEPNEHVVYLDVKRYLAHKRQGTHKAKERSEITGSRRKLRKQKGSGMARVGDIKSPIFRGGGRIFGPRPRNYDIKLNKKEMRLAKISALSQKAKDNEIIILEDFTFKNPKTKQFIEILNNLKIQDAKSLFVLNEHDSNVLLSARNVPNTRVNRTNDLNSYHILNNKKIVFVESSLEQLNELLK